MPLDFINEDMMRIGIFAVGSMPYILNFLHIQPPASKRASQISVNCNRFPFRFSEIPICKVPVAAYFSTKTRTVRLQRRCIPKQSSDGNRFLATSNCSVNL